MVAESEGCGLEETQDRAYDCGTSAVSSVRWKQPWRLAGVLGGCVGALGGCVGVLGGCAGVHGGCVGALGCVGVLSGCVGVWVCLAGVWVCLVGALGGCGRLFVPAEPSSLERIRAAVCCRCFFFEA